MLTKGFYCLWNYLLSPPLLWIIKIQIFSIKCHLYSEKLSSDNYFGELHFVEFVEFYEIKFFKLYYF